jgi:DNA-binding winged helix-turn-helix (wHTH) protein
VADNGHLLVHENAKWEIDLAARELRSQGIPVPIGRRAFDIIVALVQANEEVVTKGRLMAQVWPDAAVEDNTLQVCISAARRALGDDRGMLMTAFGRGYRMLGRWMPREGQERIALATETATQREPLAAGNLPQLGSDLIGRNSAIHEIRHRMSAYRAVTLTGPGGIGKSSLAIEVARGLLPSFGDGCWLVDLASLSNPVLVPSVVMSIGAGWRRTHARFRCSRHRTSGSGSSSGQL